MAAAETLLLGILIWFLLFLFAGIPMFLTVQLLGGKSGILKAALVVLLLGIVSSVLQWLFGAKSLIIFFLVSIVIFREVFRLKWWKATILGLVYWLVVLVLALLFGLIGLASILGFIALF